ncbi:Cupin superfamily protein [Seminavis robusta]|uniref:Bifunctional lysine-specific demethylase and histidyl-hydroxylase n=1 Tax=Seminavis robusta TaxID=568900 RepID=A0A9N8ERR3_9STRA|nr:Cupin superfamily protein [Seminavis robusta]|eukprot:Sro1908_g304710.1 Cupin superfamily protein (645) ;mRNA; f:921-2959
MFAKSLPLVLALLELQRVSAWVNSPTPAVSRSIQSQDGWMIPNHHHKRHLLSSSSLAATLEPQEKIASDDNSSQKSLILDTLASVAQESKEYASTFGVSHTEAAVYAVFSAIRNSKIPLGMTGAPFVLRRDEIIQALQVEQPPFDHFFTLQDLATAVEEDFLDAARGSTDNRKGWQITTVSNPRGESFEEARMTFEDVEAALDKGTVILNAIGAHVPKLAAPALACTDATSLPNAINLYVTAAGKRTSAPPHTDRQDVVVVQTSGQKHWRVFAPPNPAQKPMADVFARGKGDDNLPLHVLLDENSGNELLVETVLNMGDVLFIPAAFPHTTSTSNIADEQDATSVHLTFNIDSHVWELDYLSARRLALKRGCVHDAVLGQTKDTDNRYQGKVNQLPSNVRDDLLKALPMGLLDEDGDTVDELLKEATAELKRISSAVDEETAAAVDEQIWEDTMVRLRQQGMELLETHRDMYLAAMQEGKTREAEEAMTEHLGDSATTSRKTMTPERMQRLSLFRVKKYYDQIDASKNSLREWSYLGKPAEQGTTTAGSANTLPADWAFTLPVKIGDQVEADLGGAFFDATVTRVAGSKYDVQFFDGDSEIGLDRSMLKLKTPPAMGSDDEVDTSSMTPKQLKRWRKEQEKKKS